MLLSWKVVDLGVLPWRLPSSGFVFLLFRCHSLSSFVNREHQRVSWLVNTFEIWCRSFLVFNRSPLSCHLKMCGGWYDNDVDLSRVLELSWLIRRHIDLSITKRWLALSIWRSVLKGWGVRVGGGRGRVGWGCGSSRQALLRSDLTRIQAMLTAVTLALLFLTDFF